MSKYILPFAFLSILFLTVGTLQAHDPQTLWQPSMELRVMESNDLIGGTTDRYFTNGTRVELIRNFHFAPRPGENVTPNPSDVGWPFLVWRFFKGPDIMDVFYGLSAGQNIYSPNDIKKAELVVGDRPYGAWTYLGIFWGVNKERKHHSIQHRLDLDFGLLGGTAAGGPVQSIVHEYISPTSPTPQGWGQLTHGENAIRAAYSMKHVWNRGRFTRAGYHFNLNLGNVHTDVSLGGIFKIGLLGGRSQYGKHRGYVPESIISWNDRPDALAYDIQKPRERYGSDGVDIYFFINPIFTLVGYNGHLDGGLFDPNKKTIPAYEFEDLIAFNQLSGDVDILQKLYSFNYLIIEPTQFPDDKILRYHALYRPVFNSTNHSTIGVDFLLFNSLFNSRQLLSGEEKMLILGDLMENAITDPTERFLYTNAIMNDGQPMDPALRFLAYYLLVTRMQSGAFDPVVHNLIYRQLIEKKADEDSYVVKRKKYHGTLRMGLVFEVFNVSLSVIGNWRSQEFFQRKELHGEHFVGEIQVSIRW